MCHFKIYVLMVARYFNPQHGLKGWSEGWDTYQPVGYMYISHISLDPCHLLMPQYNHILSCIYNSKCGRAFLVSVIYTSF